MAAPVIVALTDDYVRAATLALQRCGGVANEDDMRKALAVAAVQSGQAAPEPESDLFGGIS
jgi:hypothetical protein